MRLLLRAPMLLLGLLAWAATTSAECAWVLWLRGSDIKMSWAILEAFSSLPACDESLYLDMDKLKRDGYEVRGDQKSGHGFLAMKGDVKRVYYCLPDTVDTRGPEGGAQ